MGMFFKNKLHLSNDIHIRHSHHVQYTCIIHSRLSRLRRLMVVKIREEVDGARFVDRFSSVSSVSGISG